MQLYGYYYYYYYHYSLLHTIELQSLYGSFYVPDGPELRPNAIFNAPDQISDCPLAVLRDLFWPLVAVTTTFD